MSFGKRYSGKNHDQWFKTLETIAASPDPLSQLISCLSELKQDFASQNKEQLPLSKIILSERNFKVIFNLVQSIEKNKKISR